MNKEDIVKEVIKELEERYYLVPRGVGRIGFGEGEFINYVLEFVCGRRGVSMEELKGGLRFGYIIEARQMCFMLIRNRCTSRVSHKVIAGFFNKNVETIKFHARKSYYYMQNDMVYRRKYEELEREFMEVYKSDMFNLQNK